MASTEYAIRYFRDEFWANRFRAAGIANKPVGWQLSSFRYKQRAEAMRDVAHINGQRPVHPVELVTLMNGVERG